MRKRVNLKPSEEEFSACINEAFTLMTSYLNDITIISAENEQINTNKMLLSLYSPKLTNIISSLSTVIHLPDCSTKSIKILISIITKGFTETLGDDTDDIIETVDTAELLGINIRNFKFFSDNQTKRKMEHFKVENLNSKESTDWNKCEVVELIDEEENLNVTFEEFDRMIETIDHDNSTKNNITKETFISNSYQQQSNETTVIDNDSDVKIIDDVEVANLPIGQNVDLNDMDKFNEEIMQLLNVANDIMNDDIAVEDIIVSRSVDKTVFPESCVNKDSDSNFIETYKGDNLHETVENIGFINKSKNHDSKKETSGHDKIKKAKIEKMDHNRDANKIDKTSTRNLKSVNESSNKLNIECQICSKHFNLKKHLDQHYVVHFRDDLPMFTDIINGNTCIPCDKTFANHHSLLVHVGVFHNKIDLLLSKKELKKPQNLKLNSKEKNKVSPKRKLSTNNRSDKLSKSEVDKDLIEQKKKNVIQNDVSFISKTKNNKMKIKSMLKIKDSSVLCDKNDVAKTRKKGKFSKEQLAWLMAEYDNSDTLNDSICKSLSNITGLKAKQIERWFVKRKFTLNKKRQNKAEKSNTNKGYFSKKKKFSEEQKSILMAEFDNNEMLDELRCSSLVDNTGLSTVQVKIWFQNERKRRKHRGSSSIKKNGSSSKSKQEIVEITKPSNLKKKAMVKFSKEQISLLRAEFEKSITLNDSICTSLVNSTGLKVKQIKRWFIKEGIRKIL